MSRLLTLAPRAAQQPRVVPQPDRDRQADEQRLRALTAEVRRLRPQLFDRWEATAVVESLGYNDGRVRQEFGLANTLEVGDLIAYERRAIDMQVTPWQPEVERASRIALRSAVSTLVYAVPWLSVFVAQTIEPAAMQLPTEVAPAVSLALMFSLVVSGGFVQTIVRRGEFYVGNKQVGLAKDVVGLLTRSGVAVTVVLALVGVLAGRYFGLAGWPALILGADVLVTLSALWMACAAFTIWRQQWRVSVTFGFGFAAFIIARQLGADVLTAQLVAAAVLLVVALAQSQSLFVSLAARTQRVRLPQLSVVIYSTAPYFWYGLAYFSFLFADRLMAGVSSPASSNAAFGLQPAYVAGMELALLTFLLAATGLEVASGLFSRAMINEARRPFLGDASALIRALRRHHLRALAFTAAGFVVSAAMVSGGARYFLGDTLAAESWQLFAVGNAGYFCLALGLVNALALFQSGRPWVAVRALSIALAVNLIAGFVLGHMFGTNYAAVGLLIGAATFMLGSTIDVRRALAQADYSFAAR